MGGAVNLSKRGPLWGGLSPSGAWSLWALGPRGKWRGEKVKGRGQGALGSYKHSRRGGTPVNGGGQQTQRETPVVPHRE